MYGNLPFSNFVQAGAYMYSQASAKGKRIQVIPSNYAVRTMSNVDALLTMQ